MKQLNDGGCYSVEMLGWDVGDSCVLRRTATHSILFNFIIKENRTDYRLPFWIAIEDSLGLGWEKVEHLLS